MNVQKYYVVFVTITWGNRVKINKIWIRLCFACINCPCIEFWQGGKLINTYLNLDLKILQFTILRSVQYNGFQPINFSSPPPQKKSYASSWEVVPTKNISISPTYENISSVHYVKNEFAEWRFESKISFLIRHWIGWCYLQRNSLFGTTPCTSCDDSDIVGNINTFQ